MRLNPPAAEEGGEGGQFKPSKAANSDRETLLHGLSEGCKMSLEKAQTRACPGGKKTRGGSSSQHPRAEFGITRILKKLEEGKGGRLKVRGVGGVGRGWQGGVCVGSSRRLGLWAHNFYRKLSRKKNPGGREEERTYRSTISHTD